MSNIAETWSKLNNRDVEVAKFKIGQEVYYCHDPTSIKGQGKITGVAWAGDAAIEYSVEGFHFLLWEEEIKGVVSE